METEQEFKNTKELVRYFLESSPRCRDDDKYLTFKVVEYICEKHSKKLFIPFEIFKDLPSYETISRARRYIQNKEGSCKPSSEVSGNRKARQKVLENINGWL